jgi:hypothetical protein
MSHPLRVGDRVTATGTVTDAHGDGDVLVRWDGYSDGQGSWILPAGVTPIATAEAIKGAVPKSDVSDEQIKAAIGAYHDVGPERGFRVGDDRATALVPTVRALLDAQAAAHAAEVERMGAQLEVATRLHDKPEYVKALAEADAHDGCARELMAMTADRDAYRARIDANPEDGLTDEMRLTLLSHVIHSLLLPAATESMTVYDLFRLRGCEGLLDDVKPFASPPYTPDEYTALRAALDGDA